MDINEIANRFKFHPAKDEETKEKHKTIRDHCGSLAMLINEYVPEGREKALAITKLEEVMMWANAGIARNG